MGTFTGKGLAQIAFPLGGIGTGTVSLNGRGALQDWELWNRPGKGNQLWRTFNAIRVEPRGQAPVARVLEREYLPPFSSALGFHNGAMAGLPRFREATFTGPYPFARVQFEDAAFPAEVSLEAYSPFVPMDVAASSIPGALLTYRVRNTTKAPMRVSLLAVMRNPVAAPLQEFGRLGWNVSPELAQPYRGTEGVQTAWREGEGFRGLSFTAPGLDADDPRFGSAALTTAWGRVEAQTTLRRAGWWDALHELWDLFAAEGRLDERRDTIEKPAESSALCLQADLGPGETVDLPLAIHWHFPNARLWDGALAKPVKTWVGRQFADAWAAAGWTYANLPRLEADTRAFASAFWQESLPPELTDAAGSALSTLRSPTVLRLDDGRIYAWEGSGDTWGSCPGSCTHVWNYEQALAFLFPELERSMREVEFGPSLKDDGAIQFRCDVPGAPGSAGFTDFVPCADGQMGGVAQAWRDWQLIGDDDWLKMMWPKVKRALEYAWTAPNGWDADQDGVMEGAQHNTYDIEFYGPNTMMGAIYLAALKAGEAMARYLGETDSADLYARIAASGRAKMETELWNGDYFIQKTQVAPGLTLPRHLTTPNTDPPFPKYQYGLGCLSDQLLGQSQAHVYGLGHLMDPAKVKAAVAAIHRHNFKTELRDTPSVQRVYALQDEAGLLLCSWPGGGRPALPFVYSDEVWTGIEYQVAAHLIYEGLAEEGLQIVRAVRDRYDGERRNPWDEIEWGHHYARALSSWSLVQAASGARYSAVDQSLTFSPNLPEPFTCFVPCGSAWGVARFEGGAVTFDVSWGGLTLRTFGRSDRPRVVGPRTYRAGDRIAVLAEV